MPRLYNHFSSSVLHWAIMQQHVRDLTVKSLSVARWGCAVPDARDGTSTVCTEVTSSAEGIQGELMTRQFLLCMVFWYIVLYQISHSSKNITKSHCFPPNAQNRTWRSQELPYTLQGQWAYFLPDRSMRSCRV